MVPLPAPPHDAFHRSTLIVSTPNLITTLLRSLRSASRLRALLRRGDGDHADTDRELARGALPEDTLTNLARRRLPRDTSRTQAVRHDEIRCLAIALREALRALKAPLYLHSWRTRQPWTHMTTSANRSRGERWRFHDGFHARTPTRRHRPVARTALVRAGRPARHAGQPARGSASVRARRRCSVCSTPSSPPRYARKQPAPQLRSCTLRLRCRTQMGRDGYAGLRVPAGRRAGAAGIPGGPGAGARTG